MLTKAMSLRTVRLNLDFHDDHGGRCIERPVRSKWYNTFKNVRGREIVDILDSLPLLEYVELLYHGIPNQLWVQFLPKRYPEPRYAISVRPEFQCVGRFSKWSCHSCNR